MGVLRGVQPTFDIKNAIVVNSKEDLLNIDSSKVYIVDGAIDMGTQSVEVPEGGLSIAGLNGSRATSKLISTENNFTLFTVAPSGSFSGPVVTQSMTIDISGTNSKVYDLDNDENSHAIDISGVNYENCTSLGDLTSYRQLLLDDVGFIFIEDGITFNGTMSGGIAVLTTIAIGFPAAATMFKEGASFILNGSIRSDINFLSVDASSVLFDFQESNISNDGAFSLTNVRTIATNAIPNVPSSSVKARFRNCSGIDNTYIGGNFTVSSDVATTISTVNTLVKMAGTTTYDDLQWSQANGNNSIESISSLTYDIEVKGTLSFSGGNNDKMGLQIRLWDDSASAYVNVGPRYTATLNGGSGSTRVENLPFFANATLNENDRIEIWIENQTDTTDITADVGGFVAVEERQS